MFDFKNINIRLLAVNIILLVAGLLLSDPFHLFESSYDKAPKFFKGISKSDISEIKIISNAAPAVALRKSESGWSVSAMDQQKDYPADEGKIEGALESLLDMRKYYEVTGNPEKYDEFEVGGKGLLVEIKGSKKTFSFYIGRQGSSFNTSLIRLKDDKTVYSVRGNLKSQWNQNPDYFRVKQFFHVAKENLKEVSITGPVNLQLKNSENAAWSLQQGAISLETNAVRTNRLIDDISLLEGTEFYYLPFVGFPYGMIKIVLKSNTAFNLEVNKIGNEYIAKTEQNPYWQKIPEYRIKSLFPDINEIKAGTKK